MIEAKMADEKPSVFHSPEWKEVRNFEVGGKKLILYERPRCEARTTLMLADAEGGQIWLFDTRADALLAVSLAQQAEAWTRVAVL